VGGNFRLTLVGGLVLNQGHFSPVKLVKRRLGLGRSCTPSAQDHNNRRGKRSSHSSLLTDLEATGFQCADLNASEIDLPRRAERQQSTAMTIALECGDDCTSSLEATDSTDEINESGLVVQAVADGDEAALLSNLHFQPTRVIGDIVAADTAALVSLAPVAAQERYISLPTSEPDKRT
jgi:hypothetical protein